MLISLDISTSVIGYCIFDENYKLHEASYVKFTQGVSLFKKLDEFIKHFEKYEGLEFTEIAIETALIAFKGKFSNANTIAMLNQFNFGISSYLYKKYGVEPVFYNVQTARKIVFPNLVVKAGANSKDVIWQSVMELEPTISWKYKKKGVGGLSSESYDVADSFVIGMAHILTSIKAKKALGEKTSTV